MPPVPVEPPPVDDELPPVEPEPPVEPVLPVPVGSPVLPVVPVVGSPVDSVILPVVPSVVVIGSPVVPSVDVIGSPVELVSSPGIVVGIIVVSPGGPDDDDVPSSSGSVSAAPVLLPLFIVVEMVVIGPSPAVIGPPLEPLEPAAPSKNGLESIQAGSARLQATNASATRATPRIRAQDNARESSGHALQPRHVVVNHECPCDLNLVTPKAAQRDGPAHETIVVGADVVTGLVQFDFDLFDL